LSSIAVNYTEDHAVKKEIKERESNRLKRELREKKTRSIRVVEDDLCSS